MNPEEPKFHAKRISNQLFEATGSLTRIAQDVRNIASAMDALGLSSGADLYRMGEEIAEHARAVAHSYGEYVSRQADGTLYASIEESSK